MAQVNLSAMFMNMSTQSVDTQQNVKSTSGDFGTSLSKARASSETSKTKTDVSRSQDQTAKAKDTKRTNDKVDKTNDNNKSADNKVTGEKDQDVKKSNDDNKTNAAQKTKDTQKTEKNQKAEDKKEPAADEKQVSDQIITLVSQIMNMPEDELKELLNSMQMEAKDLLTTEGFGKFVSQAFAGGDTSKLLTGEVDMNKVNTLFNQLQSFKEQLQTETVKPLEDNGASSQLSDILTDTGNNVVSVTDSTQIQSPDQLSQNAAADVQIQTTGQSQTVKNQDLNNTVQNSEFNPNMTAQNQQTEGAADIGITVPVHNFTTTVFTQTMQTADGAITQTITSRQAEGTHFILDQVDFKVLGQTKELSVQLSPKELGTMNIKIVENNGSLVAEIKVDNEKTKDFIQNEIATLKDQLEKQGLDVADVKVDVRQGDGQQQMQQERQKSARRIQEIISQQFEASDEEIPEDEPVISGDSEVDYMV